jgi:gas vesicle protein
MTTMNEKTPTSTVGPMLLTFAAGAALGAVVVALTTPKSGPELRGNLKDLARRTKQRAGDLAEDAGLAWNGMKERTVLAASDLKRGMNDAADDLRG